MSHLWRGSGLIGQTENILLRIVKKEKNHVGKKIKYYCKTPLSCFVLGRPAAGCLPNPNYPQLSDANRLSVIIYWSSALNRSHTPLDAIYTDEVQDLNAATLYNHMGISSNECRVLP